MDRELAVVLQFLNSRGLNTTAQCLREEAGINCTINEPNVLQRAIEFYDSFKNPGAKPLEFPGCNNKFLRDVQSTIEDVAGNSNPTCVACDPCSDRIVVGSAGAEVVILSPIEVILSATTPTAVLSVAWSSGGDIVATCMGGEVVILNSSDLSITCQFRQHGSTHVLNALFSPSSAHFLTFGRDSTIAIYRKPGSQWELHHVFRFATSVGSACWVNEGVIAVGLYESYCLYYYSIDSLAEVGRSHLNQSVQDFSLKAVPLAMDAWRGEFIAVSVAPNTVRIYQFMKDCPVRSFYTSNNDEYSNRQVAFSADGSTLLVIDGCDIAIFETQSQQQVHRIPVHAKCVRSLARRKDRFVTVSFDRCLKIL